MGRHSRRIRPTARRRSAQRSQEHPLRGRGAILHPHRQAVPALSLHLSGAFGSPLTGPSFSGTHPRITPLGSRSSRSRFRWSPSRISPSQPPSCAPRDGAVRGVRDAGTGSLGMTAAIRVVCTSLPLLLFGCERQSRSADHTARGGNYELSPYALQRPESCSGRVEEVTGPPSASLTVRVFCTASITDCCREPF